MHDRDDPITSAVLSGSAYERLQYTEGSLLAVPIPRALTLQATLLASLALILPLYALFPATIHQYVPTTDPFLASPKLLVLGFFGWSMQLLAAASLVAMACYRLRREPLSERQARTLVDVQQIATGMSLVTGGLAIAVTLAIVALGTGGEPAVGAYLSNVAASNPFVEMELGVSVGHLAALSVAGSLLVLGIRAVVVRLLVRT